MDWLLVVNLAIQSWPPTLASCSAVVNNWWSWDSFAAYSLRLLPQCSSRHPTQHCGMCNCLDPVFDAVHSWPRREEPSLAATPARQPSLVQPGRPARQLTQAAQQGSPARNAGHLVQPCNPAKIAARQPSQAALSAQPGSPFWQSRMAVLSPPRLLYCLLLVMPLVRLCQPPRRVKTYPSLLSSLRVAPPRLMLDLSTWPEHVLPLLHLFISRSAPAR
jgi:hypothetical protein